MSRLKGYLFLMVLLVGALASLPAMAMSHGGGTAFNLEGGVNYGINNSGAVGFLGGATLDLGLGSKLGLEVGGYYVTRKYSFADLSTNINSIEIPAVLRIMLSPMVSLGLGGYYDVPTDSADGSIYGARGDLKINLGHSPLFIKAAFDYGLGASAAPSPYPQDIQGLLGLRL